jgi:hypothetical protein
MVLPLERENMVIRGGGVNIKLHVAHIGELHVYGTWCGCAERGEHVCHTYERQLCIRGRLAFSRLV